MHDEQNWRILCGGFGGCPIQGNVSSIFKEYFLSFKVELELELDKVVNGLKKWMREVEGRFKLKSGLGRGTNNLWALLFEDL